MEARQRLLLRELTHRVKNTLTVVQSITHQTRRFSKSYEEFTERLDGRLAALAAAHTLLVDSDWRGADLATLAQSQLALFSGDPARVRISGESVFLPADLTTPFALVFHELATNAAKFGALSQREGAVGLVWNLSRRKDQPLLTLTWRERGGPNTAEPKTKGFGTELIERAIPKRHRATRLQRRRGRLHYRRATASCAVRYRFSEGMKPISACRNECVFHRESFRTAMMAVFKALPTCLKVFVFRPKARVELYDDLVDVDPSAADKGVAGRPADCLAVRREMRPGSFQRAPSSACRK